MKSLKVIISGGGTGGHIFPAVAIAQEIKNQFPNAEILFIGAEGKMEMQKIPQAGFNIVALPIAGLQRGEILSNIKLPFKVLSSLWKARKIIKNFKPNFVVGTGGYASAPSLKMAQILDIPVFIQEQNAIPGATNKFLSKKAKAVFTAFPNMEKYFGNTPIFYFGNPIRENISNSQWKKEEAKISLGLNPTQICILSVGGSLGSRNINNAWVENQDLLEKLNVQLLWQTGSTDYPKLSNQKWNKNFININEFIKDMSVAYAAADLVVSRAGAISISELSVVKKASLLVPLATAAANHQTINAETLVDKNAALMIKDVDLAKDFANKIQELVVNQGLREKLSANICDFAKANAAKDIVNQIIKSLNIN